MFVRIEEHSRSRRWNASSKDTAPGSRGRGSEWFNGSDLGDDRGMGKSSSRLERKSGGTWETEERAQRGGLAAYGLRLEEAGPETASSHRVLPGSIGPAVLAKLHRSVLWRNPEDGMPAFSAAYPQAQPGNAGPAHKDEQRAKRPKGVPVLSPVNVPALIRHSRYTSLRFVNSDPLARAPDNKAQLADRHPRQGGTRHPLCGLCRRGQACTDRRRPRHLRGSSTIGCSIGSFCEYGSGGHGSMRRRWLRPGCGMTVGWSCEEWAQ